MIEVLSLEGNIDLWAKMIHLASEVMTYEGNYGTVQSLLGYIYFIWFMSVTLSHLRLHVSLRATLLQNWWGSE